MKTSELGLGGDTARLCFTWCLLWLWVLEITGLSAAQVEVHLVLHVTKMRQI
jgi:hypothetical protein